MTRPRSMPHMWSFAQQREQYLHVLQKEHDDLVLWAQLAYVRLQQLMESNVSISPDVVTAELLELAPDKVKGKAA